jgi:hypothetical protein
MGSSYTERATARRFNAEHAEIAEQTKDNLLSFRLHRGFADGDWQGEAGSGDR